MKRIQQKRAGFDCPHGNCPTCADGHRSNHGVSGGLYWWGLVADEGDVAVVLALHADDWPETVEHRERMIRDCADDRRRGCWPVGSLLVHASAPMHRDEYLRPEGERQCEFLGGQPCYGRGMGSSLTATEKFRDVVAVTEDGRLAYDQPEPFWARLEEVARRWIDSARKDMAEAAKWRLCPTCEGEQTIPVTQSPNPTTALRVLGALVGERGGALHLTAAQVRAVDPTKVRVRLAEDGGLHVEVAPEVAS